MTRLCARKSSPVSRRTSKPAASGNMRLTSQRLSGNVDSAYDQYVAALPVQTAAIKAGQRAWERRVA